ncbi:equatorin [Tamandua tetradactyla]|uniref:equatorin n=1 Tax=Tamandua tetradactyla TaxID=48850 RepID=UPI004053C2A1
MNLILLAFLYGIFSSGISDFEPSFEEFPDAIPLIKQEKKDEEQKNKDKVPANEKTGNYYKDIKEYTFKTQSTTSGEAEISVRATTDVNFVLRNNKAPNETTITKSSETVTETTTRKPTEETTEPTKEATDEAVEKFSEKSTKGQNDSAFWTMLSEVLNETTMEDRASDKDQLYRPIPGSDVLSGDKDKPSELEEVKLKLMLGISLMTLFLFLILLTICCVMLYKLNKLSSKDTCETQYSVNPELASLSYFHPSEGISDTSFSKSAESSIFWGKTSSEIRRANAKRSKSRTLTDMISTASEDIYINDESDFPHFEGPNEEIQTE